MHNNKKKPARCSFASALCVAASLLAASVLPATTAAAEPAASQFASKPVLAQSSVQRILEAASAHAIKNQWPVSIVVVDDGGHMLGMVRLDGAFPLTVDIATGKARTSALTRWESGFPEQMINQGRYSLLSVNGVFLEGGIPVKVDGQTVGAVAASGVTSEQDAEIARAGIAALGL